MRFAELKREIRHLPPKQRRELVVLLARMADRECEDQLADELARRHAEMDAGDGPTLADLERQHHGLISKSR